MAVGKPLNLRLFLEGVEIPVVSAVITANIGSAAAASIQIVPLDEAVDFKPRTMVHLFYRENPQPTVKSVDTSKQITVNDVNLDDYKLAFAGEMVGISIVQTPQSRGVILQCLDFSSYFDAAHAMAIEYGPNGNAFTPHVSLAGGSTGLFDDIVNQQQNQIVSWLHGPPLTPGLTSVSGLAGGIIKIMEVMGGVTSHHKGVNDFFTVGELRCRILAQITAEEKDNTASRLMAGKVFDEWLRNGLQNIGLQVTFRDIMHLLFSYIYYDFAPNPMPKYDQVRAGATTVVPGKTTPLKQLPAAIDALGQLQNIKTNLDGLQTGEFNQNIVNESVKGRIDDLNQVSASLKKLQASTPTTASTLSSVQNQITRAVNGLTSFLSSNAAVAQLAAISANIQQAIELINNAQGGVKQSSVVKTDSTTARLHTQIIRPDCWFAPAPRCNVIFPEHYTQISYDRNYITECTRLLVQVYNTLVGPDALFADYILAPNIGFQSTGVNKAQGVSSYRVVMDHELHTGIIPRSEWIPNTAAGSTHTSDDDKTKLKGYRLTWAKRAALFHFFKYRFASRTVNLAGRFNPYLVAGFPGAVIRRPFIVNGDVNVVANAANTQTVGPSDDQLTLNFVLDNAQSLGAPYQFVGLVTSVQHSLDQSGGTSTVSMSHVRKHLGVDDEFLGIYLEKDPAASTRLVKTSFTYQQAVDLADQSLLKLLAGVTPQVSASSSSGVTQRKVTQVQSQSQKLSVDPKAGGVTTLDYVASISVTDETGTLENQNPAPPLTVRGRIQDVSRDDVLVPSPAGRITIGNKGRYGGTITGIEVLDSHLIQDPQFGQLYSAVAIYESLPIKLTSTLPVEEVLRPSWFSDAYSNANIGSKIYDPFFGCPSIVDDLLVQGLVPTPSLTSSDGDAANFTANQTPAAVIDQLVQEGAAKSAVSIEKALTLLSFIYGQVISAGKDVDEFIRSYTGRPIATLTDIMGDPDLDFTVVNGKAVPVDSTKKIGFFSHAVNRSLVQAGNLAGLADDPLLNLPRVNQTGKDSSIPPNYDVRKAKQDQVLNYVSALSRGPAFRG